MNTYLLLRNNKETGPYNLDQVVKMGLKKYDLVWVEGKSAAWRYPGEIEELKPYAPPLDELPFSQPVKKDNGTVAATIANDDVYAQQKAAANARPKPRIRIKAEWSRIETPAAVIAEAEKAAYRQPEAAQKAPAQPVTGDKPTWESQWLNWQEEQNAAKMVAPTKPSAAPAIPAMAANTPNNAVNGTTATTHYIKAENNKGLNNSPVLETKFSQSLSDIKEMYAATVLKAKTRASEPKKFKSLAVILMLAIPVMCFGVWLGSKWTKKSDATGQVVYAKTTSPAIQPAVAQRNNDEPVDNAANTQAAVKSSGKEMIPDFDNNSNTTHPIAVAVKHKTLNKLPAAVPAGKQPVADKKQNTPAKKFLITSPNAARAGERVKAENKAPAAGAQTALHQPPHPVLPVPEVLVKAQDSKPAFPHSVKNESVSDYVTVEADKPYTQTVQDVKLNVQNIADVPLDLVVIDVEYFDAANRFKNGQTIRIKNIPAGETVNINIPDNPNATKLRYKVALVSADKKNVYIVGE